MARFRGIIQGSRGMASRLGHATSGLTATCNGWHSGITTFAQSNKDVDVFTIQLNSSAKTIHGMPLIKLFYTCNDGPLHTSLQIHLSKYIFQHFSEVDINNKVGINDGRVSFVSL